MSLRVFTNTISLNAQRAMSVSSAKLESNLERVASGIRLQRSSDNNGAFQQTETLRGDVSTLRQGAKNLNDGISMIRTAEGALNEQINILMRLRELASQSINGTLGNTERATQNLEFSALRAEFDRIAENTEFNHQKLLDGSLASSASKPVTIQIGLDSGDDSRFNLNQDMNLTAMTSSALNFSTSSISTDNAAVTALDNVNSALEKTSNIRSRVGIIMERMDFAKSNLNNSIEKIGSTIASIRDTDFAEELASLTTHQVLVQGASAMVGQANLIPQSVLTLLGDQ
ncbi:MAG: flagellin FliC [Nitrospina sp.]|nr:flagellin FliC [Nitrospina sp.]